MSNINMDWENLPFTYFRTDYNVRCYSKDGVWGELEVSTSEFIRMHMAATCLHYGQQAFEGMKAYRGPDNKIRIFRWKENSKRFNQSARVLLMPEVPSGHFKKAICMAVQKNREYVPPFGSGATLYIRPLLIGIEPHVGVTPAGECMFIVFVTPVGPYFKEGFHPVDFLITRQYDRAAPLGTGHVKVGGNYAAGLQAMQNARNQGYASVIFLDAKEKKYIDECGPANFFAIKNNTYITPKSESILRSITNMSLMDLAIDMGMNVEQRPIRVEELSSFDEVGACGTGAVITPINKIIDPAVKKEYEYCKNGKVGPITQKLYNELLNIQFGISQDRFGWIDIVNAQLEDASMR